MSAFWNKLKKEEGAKAKNVSSSVKAKKDNNVKNKVGKKAEKVKADKEKAGLYSRVILRPVISENAMNQQVQNKYVFEVSARSSKPEIAQAVSAMYGVNVLSVNTIKYNSQVRNFRMKAGKTRSYKKAIVSIKAGQKIEFFSE